MVTKIYFPLFLTHILCLAGGQPTTTGCTTVNVCYAIDESPSISSADFELQAEAVIDITAGILSRAPGSAFSAVGFTSSAELIQGLTTNVTGQFNSAIENNLQTGGGTSSGPGLTLCNDILNGATSDDPKLIVLLTDGEDDGSGEEVAPGIRMNGTTIATIGVGSGTNSSSLMEIASDPSLFIPVQNFSIFADQILDIVDVLCGAVEPAPSCVEFDCIRCGRVLECYVNTGSETLDDETCALVLTRFKFCPIRHGRQTICGQPCTILDGTQCFTGQDIPNMCPAGEGSGSPLRCQGGTASGEPAIIGSFATYRICNGNKFTCRGKSDRGFEIPTCVA